MVKEKEDCGIDINIPREERKKKELEAPYKLVVITSKVKFLYLW
jgi:hypothetical protein